MADEENEQNPFSRPGFVVAAVVVVALVIAGVIVGVNLATRDDDEAAQPTPSASASTSSSTSAEPSDEPSTEAADASVCGLDGEELSGTLTTAPDAEWKYQGTTAYPSSPKFGPGEGAATGVRTCFQHSPTGALFMAANAIVQGSDPNTAAAWAEYALADGQFHDQLVTDLGGSSGTQGRMTIEGFRMLNYDGDTARVDLAVATAADGQPVSVSGVYELVWQNGDWKISTDVAQPLNIAAIPNASGYVSWGE